MNVEVAVIGGGAAGTAAALTLAQAGVRVAAVAPPYEGCDQPGESLAVGAQSILEELDLAIPFAQSPHRAAQTTYAAWGSHLPAQRTALTSPNGLGYVLDRPQFERMLRAVSNRAQIQTIDTEVTAVNRSAGNWRIQLATGSDIEAHLFIDCSGRSAVAARTLQRRQSLDRLVAAYAFLTQTSHDVEPTPATLIESVREGWWYAALLPDRRLSVAFFTDADVLPKGALRDSAAFAQLAAQTQLLRPWMESAGYAFDQPPKLASAATSWLERAAGEDWAAAGDAAAAFDPLSSHGLTTALWSGRRAALAVVRALRGDCEPLAAYAGSIEDAVRAFCTQRSAVYGRERRFRESPFWVRRLPKPEKDASSRT